jgi:hypothetical protein
VPKTNAISTDGGGVKRSDGGNYMGASTKGRRLYQIRTLQEDYDGFGKALRSGHWSIQQFKRDKRSPYL